MRRAWLIVLSCVPAAAASAGCDRHDSDGAHARPVPTAPMVDHATLPPPIWVIEQVATDACQWTRRSFTATAIETQVIARFPAACEEADLAWSGDHAVVWLEAHNRDRIFSLTLGGPPVEIPLPRLVADKQAFVRAIGFDDGPLLITTADRDTAGDRDARAWRTGAGGWVEVEHLPDRGHGELVRWRGQRGTQARTVRTPTGLTPLAPAELASLAAPTTTVASTRWLGLEAGGIRLAIRETDGRLRLDLRRQVASAWQELTVPVRVDSLRREIWPAGVEIRGTWLLLSSDGRAGVLVDAANGLTQWGAFDTALALFAP